MQAALLQLCLTAAAVVKNRCKGKGERQSNSCFGQNFCQKWRTKGSIDLVVDSGTRVTDSNSEPFDHGGRN